MPVKDPMQINIQPIKQHLTTPSIDVNDPSVTPTNIVVDTAACKSSSVAQPYRLKWGHHSMQGLRSEMEDKVILLPHPQLLQSQPPPFTPSHSSPVVTSTGAAFAMTMSLPMSSVESNSTPSPSSASQSLPSSVPILDTTPPSNTPLPATAQSKSKTFTPSLFAVLDGHGGDVSAEYTRVHLPKHLLDSPAFTTDTVRALHNALVSVDDNFIAACKRIHLLTSSGTCACVVYIDGTKLVVANVGDSRAVIYSGNKARALTVDHKPALTSERLRIEQNGGRVGHTEYEAFHPQPSILPTCCTMSNGPLRVFPIGLSVSRTLGDLSGKVTGVISNQPDITQQSLTRQDSFIIIACDGVWDCLSNQYACDTVRTWLQHGDAEQAAKRLCDAAFRWGSTDNITVIIIQFEWI